jgi:hypothetical protein
MGQPAYPLARADHLLAGGGLRRQRRPDGHGRRARSRPSSAQRRPSDFAVSGETVSWTGGADDWGLRRMILHYAHLCAAAGGVGAFLIGSELRGRHYHPLGRPAATRRYRRFRDLAADVRAILGARDRDQLCSRLVASIFGHQPGDGSGDVFFHLDPLWADAAIDFVGIDLYWPLSDWRDGAAHADAEARLARDLRLGYLQANIAGGEGYDWFYASDADRAAQVRTPITDGAAGKPWVFRYKDLQRWWSNPHVDRPGGVESATPTAWVPESKPIRFTEIGCPAIDRGSNQPNVFVDPKSAESARPHFSRGWRDDAIQRAIPRGGARLVGRPGQQPGLGLCRPHDRRPPRARSGPGTRGPIPLPGAVGRLGRRRTNWRLGTG